MKIGYARVSTEDQRLDAQLDALNDAGCEMIFEEKQSGKSADRPQLLAMIAQLRRGDTVVVTKLDRLGRSLKDLIEIVFDLDGSGIHFKSIDDNIDTSTPMGKFVFHVFGALAEFERARLSQRTREGLAAARKRGRTGGRPAGLSAKARDKARLAESLYNEGERSVAEMCDHLDISKATLYRYLRSRGVQIKKA